MLKMIETVYRAMEKFLLYIVMILLALMVIIVFANVVSRYYLQFSLAWSEEIARFMRMVVFSSLLIYIRDWG